MQTPAAAPQRRRIAWDLAAAVAVYVLLRALVLHTNFDSVTLWMYELYPMGTLAEFLQRGVDFPLRFYYDNAAGQILSGFLTLPCFALAGPTYLALKLVPFVLGLGVLLIAWRWLLASHGRLAANLAVWSLALAPTTYLKYSLTNSGNHFENLFWSMLAIAAFARLVRLGASRARLFAFGLASGFALFVFLGALLPVGILCGLHLCSRGLRASLRDAPWIGLGLLLGELPLLVLNLTTGGRGLGFLSDKFAANDAATAAVPVLARIGDYLGGALRSAATYPDALGFSGAALDTWLFAALCLVWLVSLPFALRWLKHQGEDWSLALFAAYVPLSALAYGIANFRLGGHSGTLEYGGYRYYLPLFLYGMLAAAILAAKAWNARGPWRGAVALVPLGVLLPGLSNLALVDWHAPQTGLGWHYSGYDLSKAARGLLAKRNALTHDEQLHYLERFPPLVRATVTRAMGFNLAVQRLGLSRKSDGAERWSLDLCALLAEWPEDLRHELARGAGIGLRSFAGNGPASALFPGLRRTLAGCGACAGLQADFLEGLASANPALPLASETEPLTGATNGLIGFARERELAPEHVASLVRGQGFLFGGLLRRGIESDRAALVRRVGELPPERLSDFYRGLGQGCALGGEEPGLPAELPQGTGAEFWSGFVGELRQAWSSKPAELEPRLDALERALPPAAASALHAVR